MTYILIAAVLASILMAFTWGLYLITKNPGVVDFMWAIVISSVSLCFSFSRPITVNFYVMFILLLLWCLRLSGYIFITRILKNCVEKRYQAISRNWKMNEKAGFFINFQFQALLAFLVATPFIFVNFSVLHHFIFYFGNTIAAIGIIGEAVSDYQLHKFKSHHKGMVCDTGLWKFSRHPNCFFEWLVWVGFSIAVFRVDYGWVAVLSPLTVYFLMIKITIPITEDGSILSRGESYRSYMKKTKTKFFPSIPRN